MIPDGWKRSRLSDDVKLVSGQHVEARDYTDIPGGTPYLTGPADFPNGHPITTKFTTKPKVMCEKGDILVTVKGSGTGKLTRADGAYCISRQLMAVRPKTWSSDFLFYVFASFAEQLNTESVGFIPGLTRQDILSKEIPIPPLAEQKRIAAILSSVDDAIQATRAVIEQTRRVKHGLLQQLLTKGIGHKKFKQTEIGQIPETWEVVRVGEVVERIRQEVHVEKQREYRQIGIRSHAKGIFHKEPMLGEKLGNKRVFWVEPECLVINIVFAWERAVAVTSENERGMICSHRFPMFRPNLKRILLRYITLYFQSTRGKNALTLASPGGAGRNKTLGQKEFLKIPIPIPPLKEQERIGSMSNVLESTVTKREESLKTLILVKRNIMAQLLTGKKRTRH